MSRCRCQNYLLHLDTNFVFQSLKKMLLFNLAIQMKFAIVSNHAWNNTYKMKMHLYDVRKVYLGEQIVNQAEHYQKICSHYHHWTNAWCVVIWLYQSMSYLIEISWATCRGYATVVVSHFLQVQHHPFQQYHLIHMLPPSTAIVTIASSQWCIPWPSLLHLG